MVSFLSLCIVDSSRGRPWTESLSIFTTARLTLKQRFYTWMAFDETTRNILEILYYKNVNMHTSVNNHNTQILIACLILSWKL